MIGFWRILFVLTIVPLAELVLLLEVGRQIGTMQTVAVVLVTGVVGAFFASREEAAAIRRIRAEVGQGQIPSQSLLDAGIVLAGGLLLITPGLMTDAVGFACLLAPTRRLISGWIRRRIEVFFWQMM